MDELLQRGIRLFNNREFFQCHEVLEEAWTPERGPRRLFLQALIHLAVGFYHCERSNSAGASSQLQKGLHKLALYLPSSEGIDGIQGAIADLLDGAVIHQPPAGATSYICLLRSLHGCSLNQRLR
jgi:predicted metal-dependent hydrolase